MSPSGFDLCILCSSIYPLVVAAHPSEPSQFAMGLSDGAVYVVEPTETEGRWGSGSGSSSSTENGTIKPSLPTSTVPPSSQAESVTRQ